MNHLTTLPTDKLKLIQSILQQKVMLTSTHQKASHSLSHFVMETSNTDRSFRLLEEDEQGTIEALKETVKLAADGIKFIDGLGAV